MNSRQIRVIGLCAILVLLVLYYVSNGARNTRQSAFYRNTLSVLTLKQGQSGSGGGGGAPKIDLDSPEEKLKIENYKKAMRELALQFDPAGEDGARADVYQQQLDKLKSEAAVPEPTDVFGAPPTGQEPALPEAVEPAGVLPPALEAADEPAIGSEKSVAGRKKMKGDKIIPKPPAGAVADESDDKIAKTGNVGSPSHEKSDSQTPETDEATKTETELNDILKRGPIIVFSKSYCPYSRKAKHILQDFYSITPPPYVVELDKHELGPSLQSSLHSMTGRRTVPNILINGKSIGGGDDIESLHVSGKLIETIQSLGGKRIVSIEATAPSQPQQQQQPPPRGQGKLKV